MLSMLEVLFDNVEGTISSNLINVCNYIAEHYKDKFIPAGGDSGLTFLVNYLLLKLLVWWMILLLIFHNFACYLEYYDTTLVLNCLNLKRKWSTDVVKWLFHNLKNINLFTKYVVNRNLFYIGFVILLLVIIIIIVMNMKMVVICPNHDHNDSYEYKMMVINIIIKMLIIIVSITIIYKVVIDVIGFNITIINTDNSIIIIILWLWL